jgi:DUF1680 family protein
MTPWTRRKFLEVSALVSGAVATNAANIAGADQSLVPSAIVPPLDGITPAGSLVEKIKLSAERLTLRGTPAYTDPMVLADVTLDTRRRFANFSGDTSGRYLEALSLLPAAGRSPESLRHLAAQILQNQRPDGRFGRADLVFSADQIGSEHMALLWGNGRLLVGLTSYYAITRDPAVLASARKLADFLIAVREAAKAPAVIRRLEGQGAVGFICFTQLTEGLDLLGRATGQQRYFAVADEIIPLLPPRGVQHSHGYLTTLRGALMLYDDTHDPSLLTHVEELWAQLVSSSDYIVDGSVLEYFGWGNPENLPLLTGAKAASGPLPRNEGCSLADVIRLTLHLYRVTGNISYLEQAERCYCNSFGHNQFSTGDFGSRVWFEDGFTPTSSVDRAWWCCTMHGYRAFRDVLENAVTIKDDCVSVNLFEDLDWRREANMRIRRNATGATIEFEGAFPGALRIRLPPWSAGTTITRDSRIVSVPARASFADVGRNFSAQERVEVNFHYRTEILTPDLHMAEAGSFTGKSSRAAIYCGPYLMAVDEELDPYFFSEPWSGNTVSLPVTPKPAIDAYGQPRLPVIYEHDGFPGELTASLRPVSEKPANDQRTLAIWLNCKVA